MIKIYSIHYNKPEYISLQKKSIDDCVKIPYEFIVLDNSIDPSIKSRIVETTSSLNIGYVDCCNTITSMDSLSHQNALRKFVSIINDGDTVMLIDHDLFFTGVFDERYYDGYDMAYINQTRGVVNYPSTTIVIFNNIRNKNDISFNSGKILDENCDTGGFMYYYITNNNLKIRNIGESYLQDGKLLIANLDDTFVHLISGSDWNGNYDLVGKLNYIKEKFNI